jgi:hypothetical protein
MTRLLFALYLIEIGLLLVVSPWTSWWSRNYFADLVPVVGWIMATTEARVSVVVTGVVTAAIGVTDLHHVIVRRIERRPVGLDDLREP